MPTATTTPRRPRKAAARPAPKTVARSAVKSRPIAKSATRPADKSVLDSGPTAAEIKRRFRRMRAQMDPAKTDTTAHDRFHALPLKERERILKECQAPMKKALAGKPLLDSGPTAAEIKRRFRRMRANMDPAKTDTRAHDRFHALPLKERERILKEQQVYMKQALAGVMTLDDYLTERRREAERDA